MATVLSSLSYPESERRVVYLNTDRNRPEA
jgi:hypothetical protein